MRGERATGLRPARDPLSIHTIDRQRLMLRAADPDAADSELARILETLCGAVDAARAVAIFADEGIASLWDERISRSDFPARLSPEQARLTAAFKAQRWREAGLYLAQSAAIGEIDDLFERAGIGYAVFKGAQVRAWVWDDPSLRSANDIDILVHARDRSHAMAVLEKAGFSRAGRETPHSHEITLQRTPVAIDLHWDILRPERMRCDLITPFLSTRTRQGGFFGLNTEAALTVMLVHPVFARYVNNLSACNVADYQMWLRKRTIDWDAVHETLERAGFKTAAWIMLTWYAMLLGPRCRASLPAIAERLKPGPFKRAYLERWLSLDLPVRLWSIPLLTPLAFTLPAHDTAQDAVRALSAAASASLAVRSAR